MHDTMKKPRHKTPSSAKRARSASGADEGERSDHASDRGRWSSRRKTEIVLRIFGGETLDALSRELGATLANSPNGVTRRAPAAALVLGLGGLISGSRRR
jgi:hypothetical protein